MHDCDRMTLSSCWIISWGTGGISDISPLSSVGVVTSFQVGTKNCIDHTESSRLWPEVRRVSFTVKVQTQKDRKWISFWMHNITSLVVISMIYEIIMLSDVKTQNKSYIILIGPMFAVQLGPFVFFFILSFSLTFTTYLYRIHDVCRPMHV